MPRGSKVTVGCFDPSPLRGGRVRGAGLGCELPEVVCTYIIVEKKPHNSVRIQQRHSPFRGATWLRAGFGGGGGGSGAGAGSLVVGARNTSEDMWDMDRCGESAAWSYTSVLYLRPPTINRSLFSNPGSAFLDVTSSPEDYAYLDFSA